MNICIINDTNAHINYDSLEKGCGGSETWALQLGQALVDRGHFVIIFSTTDEPDKDIVYKDKLNIMSVYKILSAFENVKFDFCIVSRIMTDQIYNLLKRHPSSPKYVFYQFHDLFQYEQNYKEHMMFANKVVVLTPYHAKFLHIMSDIDYSKFSIIPNGLDLKLLENIDFSQKRDNRILWTSNPNRGLYLILKYLYDDIKKEIPDFGIDVTYPAYEQNLKNEYFENKDIKILGPLDKVSLYREMAKHKCWCYPQNFIDTFCIGMLEHAACEVNIVAPWWYAPNDIFGDLNNGFEKILINENEFIKNFYIDKINADDKIFNKYLTWLKNSIIDAIKNYDSDENKKRRIKMKSRVYNTYNWNNIAQLYETLYINEKVQHNDYEEN